MSTTADDDSTAPTLNIFWIPATTSSKNIDDMAAAHIGTEFLSDVDFQKQVAERKAKLASSTSNNQNQ